jgi:hypothetical protein
VPKNDEFALKQAAASQPVAVAICASPAMQFYQGGIIDTCCEVSGWGLVVGTWLCIHPSGLSCWLLVLLVRAHCKVIAAF